MGGWRQRRVECKWVRRDVTCQPMQFGVVFHACRVSCYLIGMCQSKKKRGIVESEVSEPADRIAYQRRKLVCLFAFFLPV